MRRNFLFVGIIVIILLLKSYPAYGYQVADIYRRLREQVFAVDPLTIGIENDGSRNIYGMIMETGYEDAVVSLIAVGDGTVSIYFSTGGGILGIGEHDKPRQVCFRYLNEAESYLKYAQPHQSF
jgi:hypothetical protein